MNIFTPITEYFRNARLVLQDYGVLKQHYRAAMENLLAARKKIYYEENVTGGGTDDINFIATPDLPDKLTPNGKGCIACFKQAYTMPNMLPNEFEQYCIEYRCWCRNFKPTSWELPTLDFAASYEENELMKEQSERREKNNSASMCCTDTFCPHVKNNWNYYETNKVRILAREALDAAWADMRRNLMHPTAYRIRTE
ncbi:MAG: hypothetical protein FWC61_00540 [Proteobacteria bacterium]|nr:hypothetical protein [Pseudomonadota bacterium]